MQYHRTQVYRRVTENHIKQNEEVETKGNEDPIDLTLYHLYKTRLLHGQANEQRSFPTLDSHRPPFVKG